MSGSGSRLSTSSKAGWVVAAVGCAGLAVVAVAVVLVVGGALVARRGDDGGADRAVAPGAADRDDHTASAAPRLGKYGCRTYGNPSNPIYIMSFTLEKGGDYTASNGDGGSWTYDEADRLIEFDNGTLGDQEFVGMYRAKGEDVEYVTGSRRAATADMIYLRQRADWNSRPGVTDLRSISCSFEE